MKALLLLPLCLLLCGCDSLPRPREMGDMALLRALAVDGGAEGYTLTASTGPRPAGAKGGEGPALVLSGEGATLTLARQKLEERGESRVFSGYVDHLLLAEQLPGGVVPVLAHLSRDRELGLGAWLWMVKEGASSALETGEKGAEPRLTALVRRAGEDFALLPRRGEEVYADLLEFGAACVPLLERREEGLFPAGYAVLKAEGPAGRLEGEGARGLELLAGQGEGQLISLERAGEQLVLEVTHATLTCRRQGDVLVLAGRVEARLAEYTNRPGAGERKELEGELEALCTARMAVALERLALWQADCLGLQAKAALTDPAAWLGREGPGLADAEIQITGAVRP